MPDAPPRYVQEMTEIEAHIGAALLHEGIPEHQAVRLTGAVVKGLCQTLGGRQVYFPRGEARNTQARNAAMLAEFDPANSTASVRHLAEKYQLTEIAVYRCLAAARAARRAELPH
jgi:Mor family transcriptional regulator